MKQNILNYLQKIWMYKLQPVNRQPKKKRFKILQEKQRNWVLDCINENQSKLKPYNCLRDKYLKYHVIGQEKSKHYFSQFSDKQVHKTVKQNDFKKFLSTQKLKLLKNMEKDKQICLQLKENRTRNQIYKNDSIILRTKSHNTYQNSHHNKYISPNSNQKNQRNQPNRFSENTICQNTIREKIDSDKHKENNQDNLTEGNHHKKQEVSKRRENNNQLIAEEIQ